MNQRKVGNVDAYHIPIADKRDKLMIDILMKHHVKYVIYVIYLNGKRIECTQIFGLMLYDVEYGRDILDEG